MVADLERDGIDRVGVGEEKEGGDSQKERVCELHFEDDPIGGRKGFVCWWKLIESWFGR